MSVMIFDKFIFIYSQYRFEHAHVAFELDLSFDRSLMTL